MGAIDPVVTGVSVGPYFNLAERGIEILPVGDRPSVSTVNESANGSPRPRAQLTTPIASPG